MLQEAANNKSQLICKNCGAAGARVYQRYTFNAGGEPHDEQDSLLCPRCARAERKRLTSQPDSSEGLTREELITELDRFFAASGVFEICRRCHEQGTGCCPPTCRVMGARGCDPNNKFGKTVFCATFVCSALLNAISECDAEIGRALKWVKQELGPAEFHIYEMITRVPAKDREQTQPLALPRRYPQPPSLPVGLKNGSKIAERLNLLVDEVLAIRRLWSEQEKGENDAQR